MLPLIAAGSAILGGAVFFGLKEKCSQCDSMWTINQICPHCKGNVCGDCGVPIQPVSYKEWDISSSTRCCKTHLQSFTDTVSRYKQAIDSELEVKVYSKNYKGKIASPKLNAAIKSQFHKEKEKAERELRIHAAQQGCNIIQNVEVLKKVESSGNYNYSVWSYSGVI